MAHEHNVTRRSFLKTAGLAAASLPLFSAKSYGRIVGANERLHTALIGCGSMGRSHLNALLGLREEENVEVIGVCDVYETRARHFQDLIWRVGGQPERYVYHDDLLENGDLDYVSIVVPEHGHASLTLDALDAGLHVYCEKPLTHTVEEAHRVVDKVRSTGRKLQVGVQGMSDDSYASAHKAIQAGMLGPVVEAQIDYVRHYPDERGPWRSGVVSDLPKPDDLDWERWLGPAPERPWDPHRYFEWRNYLDYSGGIAADLFIHRLTRILKACGLNYPTRVVGMGGIYLWDDGRELPDNMEMLAEYPAVDGITPGMTVHILGTMGNDRGNDHLIRGHDATLIFTSEGWEIVDQASGEVLETHQKTGGENVRLHYQNLFAAIRDDAPLRCPAELGRSGVVAVAGAVRSWVEKRMLTWDAEEERWV